jgi:DNA-binding MarR family transcriptional regulator
MELPRLSDITTYQSGVIQSTVYRSLRKHTDTFLQPYGLTAMQWFIIGTIYDAGDAGIRITEVAKKVDTTPSFLTHSVNLLESKGMLVRIDDAKDNRAKIVSVTEDFRPKCQQIEADLRKKLRKTLYAKIKPEDLQTYLEVLYQLTALED